MTLDLREWLEADGMGGFASGTVSGVRTRRYHALLCAAAAPPVGRMVLVNGFDAYLVRGGERAAISTQRYAPGIDHPDGASRLVSFAHEPWPTWTFAVPGAEVRQELFVVRDLPVVVLAWSGADAELEVRPFFSGRNYHALHYENQVFRMEPEGLLWRPYPGVPAVRAVTNGEYRHEPAWYKQFLYEEERARGLDHLEDLAAPGVFRFDLRKGEAILVLAAEESIESAESAGESSPATTTRVGGPLSRPSIAHPSDIAGLRARERLRRRRSPAAAAYLVRRHDGMSIIAGYPWFCDWGRDTFIALRGLCLATGRIDEARQILAEWAGTVSEGMLPNRFPDLGEAPEYNSVDGALWYVVAAYELLSAAPDIGDREAIRGAIGEILAGYARGTRMNIRADGDGLLAAGAPGWQLTWMDARVDGVEITPRIGKPVEIQALWYNALRGAVELDLPGKERWADLAERARAAFAVRFWNPSRNCLFDVVDVDHRPGATDPSLRPNQIFAVGGLPFALLDGERAAQVVAAVDRHLGTPLGLRSLAPGEPGYQGRYQGDARQRDFAYHNGTVWPWLAGPFLEACLRVGRDARPLLESLGAARAFGHLPELADGDPPHAPRGCPFQAWSLGELLRIQELLGRRAQ